MFSSFARFFGLLGWALCTPVFLLAQLGTHSPFIRVDQFGYPPSARKVAVLADPQQGFDAAQSFSPGSTYEVRRLSDDGLMFSLAPQIWNSGNTHAQSGDKGWWVDFSGLATPGTYYLYDVDQQKHSFPFEVGVGVYEEVLKAAVRTFFYQRLNIAKEPPYVDSRWSDGAAYEGANQDRAARSRWAKMDVSTARDVHGGWMDAGDPNKYTTFAEGAVFSLLEAYLQNPAVFGDDFGLPESGNGIPDLLDELMWELDWLKRMQDATATNGFLLKVGVDNYNDVSPPSQDQRPRYYLPECTSATLAGCAMFAKAAWVLQQVPALSTYAADLQDRAILAWERGRSQTQDFSNFELDCDDGNITSGDADRPVDGQMESALTAAIYLYALTDSSPFDAYVVANHTEVRPFSENWWGPYRLGSSQALLTYSQLTNANASVATAIRSQKAGMDYQYSIDDYSAGTDLYRAFLDDWAHHWGSNQIRAVAGKQNLANLHYDVNPAQHDQYREVAFAYLHHFHGLNPLNLVMLSNMYELGGENCVNEIYHTWFADQSDWDHALNSSKGPAPGYITGGPNHTFTVSSISPPANQPPQKAYKDWNTGWPENSWEITEPAIYYQAAYIELLSALMESRKDTVANSLPELSLGSLEIWPQPAQATVSVQLPSEWTGKARAQLYDLRGRAVGEQQEFVLRPLAPISVSLAGLPDGVYWLQLSSEGKVLGEKIQVLK